MRIASRKLIEVMNNRPWHEKLLVRITMYFFIIKSSAKCLFLSRPEVTEGANSACNSIREDLEFSYTREMIHSKIIHGNYGNDPCNGKKLSETRKLRSRKYVLDGEEFEVIIISPKNSHRKIGDRFLHKLIGTE